MQLRQVVIACRDSSIVHFRGSEVLNPLHAELEYISPEL